MDTEVIQKKYFQFKLKLNYYECKNDLREAIEYLL